MRPLLLSLLQLPLALAGCDSAGDANGSLRVMLTDAPGAVVAVVLRCEGARSSSATNPRLSTCSRFGSR